MVILLIGGKYNSFVSFEIVRESNFKMHLHKKAQSEKGALIVSRKNRPAVVALRADRESRFKPNTEGVE